MHHPEPTADEFRAAYKASGLRWIGVSLQKALTVPSVRISLRCKAIAMRKKHEGELCIHI
jgi:hypothetical protein